MAPGDITKTVDLGALKAPFVPFWVVSTMTYTTYKGEHSLTYHENEPTTTPRAAREPASHQDALEPRDRRGGALLEKPDRSAARVTFRRST